MRNHCCEQQIILLHLDYIVVQGAEDTLFEARDIALGDSEHISDLLLGVFLMPV